MFTTPELFSLPKAELHLHIEGTLEPKLMFQLAQQNGVALPYASVDDVKNAYVFNDLQSFLDIYYLACQVLVTEQDFFDLTWAYLKRACAQGVRHTEIFFDPQSHTSRNVAYAVVVSGISRALEKARHELAISSNLILCFLRHLSADAAMATLEKALSYREGIVGVGLDSGEAGNPPSKFADVFARARAEGLKVVAHAGEEGPPQYITEALDILEARRIDHGVRCLEDENLVNRLVAEQIPLTVCPLSNVKLRVVGRLEDHPLKVMLQRHLRVTINSDDPAYFGGYVGDNYVAVQNALHLSEEDILRLARNSFEASWLDDDSKAAFAEEITEWQVRRSAQ